MAGALVIALSQVSSSQVLGAASPPLAAPEHSTEGNGVAHRSTLGTQAADTASPEALALGRQTAMRTLGVASESGGEANFLRILTEREVVEGSSTPPHWMASSSRSVTTRGGDANGPEHRKVDFRPTSTGLHVTRRACADARRGLAYYRAAYSGWREKMGAGGSERARADARIPKPVQSCPRIRSLAAHWREKAQAARRAYELWYAWAWREWLPAKWKRIIACETGSRHDWNSGSYQGAYGFAVSSWDAFRLPGYPAEAYLATPREQFNVALAIWRRYGFSGWGCAR